MRLALLLPAALVAVHACGSSTSSGPATPGEPRNVEPFTRWAVPGLTLYSACLTADDLGDCAVYGEDAAGGRIDARGLFVRMAADPQIDPQELAHRAEVLLFGEMSRQPVMPDAPANGLVTDEERSVVRAPERSATELVYFRMHGDMRPTLTRARVVLTTGASSTQSAMEVYAETAPSTDVVCEAWSTCGCENGCASFTRVVTPAGERFRDAAGRLYFRMTAGHPLRTLADETCTEACPAAPARTTCVVVEGACVAAPAAAAAPTSER